MGKPVIDIPEPFTWQCPKCRAKGTARTKKDAELALLMHRVMVHGK